MLSVVIQALKKSVMVLCTPFENRCLIYSDWPWAFEITLHRSSARRDSPCADSPDRESGSPDHNSVRNKEVKFI